MAERGEATSVSIALLQIAREFESLERRALWLSLSAVFGLRVGQ